MTNQLTVVEPPYSEEVETLLSRYPKRNGYLLKLFRIFANSTRFLRKGVLDLLDRESPLTMRERELVILLAGAVAGVSGPHHARAGTGDSPSLRR